MRLLIVDDSNIIRTRILRIVQRKIMRNIIIVGLARNGVEAIKLAQNTKPDVVTMDLTMPEMDGIECISNLIRLFPDTNILVVSAMSDKSTAIAALRLGAQGFLPKPFTDDELCLALLDVMNIDPESDDEEEDDDENSQE